MFCNLINLMTESTIIISGLKESLIISFVSSQSRTNSVAIS